MVLGVCNNRRKCVGKVLGLSRQYLQTRYLYSILEKMSLEEFIHRDTQQMAKFIAGNVWTVPECGTVDDRPGFAKMHFMFYGEKL